MTKLLTIAALAAILTLGGCAGAREIACEKGWIDCPIIDDFPNQDP